MAHVAVTILVPLNEGETEQEVCAQLQGNTSGHCSAETIGDDTNSEAVEAVFTRLAQEQARAFETGPSYHSGE